MYTKIKNVTLFRANGSKFSPRSDGIYIPVTEEEKEICTYFESISCLQKVEEKPKEAEEKPKEEKRRINISMQ